MVVPDDESAYMIAARGPHDRERWTRQERRAQLGASAMTDWIKYDQWTPEQWREALNEAMGDYDLRTFNDLVLEVTGRHMTGDVLYSTGADAAVWDLVRERQWAYTQSKEGGSPHYLFARIPDMVVASRQAMWDTAPGQELHALDLNNGEEIRIVASGPIEVRRTVRDDEGKVLSNAWETASQVDDYSSGELRLPVFVYGPRHKRRAALYAHGEGWGGLSQATLANLDENGAPTTARQVVARRPDRGRTTFYWPPRWVRD